MRKFFLSVLFVILLAFSTADAAIDFDGTLDDGDHLTCGTGDIVPESTDFSVYARFVIDDLATDDNAILSTSGGASGEAFGFRVQNITNNVNIWKATNGAFWVGVEGATALSTGVEYSIVAVVPGGLSAAGVKFYINGTEDTYVTQVDGTGTIEDNAGGTIRIGTDAFLSDAFDGIIREVAVFSRALTATEVLTLSNSKLRGMPMHMGAVRYWMFDDQPAGTSADGDTVRDMTGAGSCTGVDAADNTGLTWTAETIINYPPSAIMDE